jgi:hypothetical protein
MASRENAHRAHGCINVIQVNPDGEWGEIRVGPELNILMPFDFLAAPRPFVIEFAVMESNGPTQDELSKLRRRSFQGKGSERFIVVNRGHKSP